MRGCPRKVNACCKTQSCWPLALHRHHLQCCRPLPCLAASLRLSSVGLFGRLEAQTSGGGGGHDQPSYATSDSHTVSTLFSLSSILPSRGLALKCFWCALRRPVRDQVAAATSRHIYTVSTLSPSRLGLDQAIWVRRGFALSLSHTFY